MVKIKKGNEHPEERYVGTEPPNTKPVPKTPNLLDQYKADGSYGTVYGDGNPWVQWLRKAKHTLVLTFAPTQRGRKHGLRGSRPPRCPACRKPMRLVIDKWRCTNLRLIWHIETAEYEKLHCNIVLIKVETIGPVVVKNEDGKRIPPEDLVNRPIDIVYDRGAYRARAVIR